MKEPFAVFTIVKNEPVWLPIWVKYYHTQVESPHIYILDHNSDGEGLTMLDGLQAAYGVNVVPVHRKHAFDHSWLCKIVADFQTFLLRSYESVLFAEADEIVATTPGTTNKSLADYARNVLHDQRQFVRCSGYEVVHKHEEEGPIDWARPLLPQREWWYPCETYSKPLLSRIPLYWSKGFHKASNVPPLTSLIDRNLLLLHLHKLDLDYCLQRHAATAAMNWNQADKTSQVGWQNRMTDADEIKQWFTRSIDNAEQPAALTRIPDDVRQII
jgi:hypothetical protein